MAGSVQEVKYGLSGTSRSITDLMHRPETSPTEWTWL